MNEIQNLIRSDYQLFLKIVKIRNFKTQINQAFLSLLFFFFRVNERILCFHFFNAFY